MPYTPTDLEAYVRQRAPQIARDISAVAEKAHNEADLVAEVEKVLDRFASSFDVTLRLDHERTLVNGRADAVYNRFVIEYEPPGSLRKEPSARPNEHAVDQVKRYMAGLERIDRHKKERLAGAVLDGDFFIFVRFRDERWHIDDPLPVDTHSTETFLRYLLSLATELALTPDNLVRDFGENSNTARQVVPAFYAAVHNTENPKVRTLFRQWQRQFREVSGYDPAGGQLAPAEVAKYYAVRDPSPDLEHLFFAIHSYYAVFLKLLAVQVALYYLAPKVGTGLAAVADYETGKLRSYLDDMEQGGLLKQLGIANFLEGDFFRWYLDIWDDALEVALRRLIGDLGAYSLVTLDVDPEETRDLLKKLYQNLMPKKLRHALGEYYTPDWLAERLLNQLGYQGDPRQRLLDPACGSGTFLVLAIKRVRKYADEKALPPADTLEKIQQNIVGFDLNPLAVLSARTNYLLALGDLLPQRTGEISIPVYLADSILTPSRGGDLFTQNTYRFHTAVGEFTIPRSLVDARYLDLLADLLEECVRTGCTTDQFKARLLKALPLVWDRDVADIRLALALYEQLQDLERQGIDGIWARIIKNAFAPIFQGRFDYVAGNPPWVNWESLPEDYRNETKPLWVHHGLFPHRGMDTILGKGKKDISMLMTYVAMDNYLKDSGRLGFVITQSVFKTSGAGQGFRRFMLGSSVAVRVQAVDDMSNLRPFEGAANRTGIVTLQRGRATRYPVPYNYWYKPTGGSTIPEDIDLDDLVQEKIATYRNHIGEPVDDAESTSPWLTGRSQALKAARKVLGASDYRAYEGSNTGGANGVYWVEITGQRPDGLVIVSNITEGAKREVESVQAAIETDLLYPLLRGRDVTRWQAAPQAHIIMVQDARTRTGIPEADLRVRLPKTYAYLSRFKDALAQRQSQSVRRLADSGAFYSIFAVGDYTFAPYKVVWREVASRLDAAVAQQYEVPGSGMKCSVPDHTIILIPCREAPEAHFVCATLNSTPSRFLVQNYIVLHPDPHILQRVRVPRFDAKNAVHAQLATLSQQAHAATAAGEADKVQQIEQEIDRQAARLWGLTDEELKEIQESLKELG
jgi:type I restriction-modification system DNA methylase subunit